MAACYSSIKHQKSKSGAEGEEEIGNSQEPLKFINFVLAMVWKKKKYVQFHFYVSMLKLHVMVSSRVPW